MKILLKFSRENPTLAFGIALPLLIAAMFLAAAKLSEVGVAPA